MSKIQSRATRVLIAIIAVLTTALVATTIALLNAHDKSDTATASAATRPDKTRSTPWVRPIDPGVTPPAVTLPWGTSMGPDDPFQTMREMQAQMDQLFEMMVSPALGSRGWAPLNSAPQQRMTVQPLTIEMDEQPTQYVVRLRGQDVVDSDVHVELNGRLLTLWGTRRSEDEVGGSLGQGVRHTSMTESFQRSMTLPGPVDGDAATTAREGEALVIVIPKAAPGERT